MNRAVFLDRDGTIIEEKEFLHRPDGVALLAGAGPALRQLQSSGFRLFIVTNQSGVGRGFFALEDVEKVNRRLQEQLEPFGVSFEKIYVAPEAPDCPSYGRKPSPRFLFDARDEFGLDLAECYMIGDRLIDLECGWNAGVKKSILVRTGYGAEVERQFPDRVLPAVVVENLTAATNWILGTGA